MIIALFPRVAVFDLTLGCYILPFQGMGEMEFLYLNRSFDSPFDYPVRLRSGLKAKSGLKGQVPFGHARDRQDDLSIDYC